MSFNTGDIVQRIDGKNKSMRPGDRDTITAIRRGENTGILLLDLKNFGTGHDATKFVLVKVNPYRKTNKPDWF